jgi:hypothetical protein
MTAEIGIMNSLGVALAADSAVTLGGTSGKIYTSADKMFQLSPTAPVGIMTYGSANFAGIPWETVVKTYRKEWLGDEFDKLEDYATDLIRFLSHRRDIFSRDAEIQEREIRIEILLRQLRNELETRFQKKGIDISSAKKHIEIELSEILKAVRKNKVILGLQKNIKSLTSRRLGKMINNKIRAIFDKIPITSLAEKYLKTISVEVMMRRCFGPWQSGIVVAGFGEKQYMPGIVEIAIDGMVEGRPRYYVDKNLSIDNKRRASIIPFAQKEMVYTFMEGIDPDLEDLIKTSVRRLFFGVANGIIDKVKKYNDRFGKVLGKKVNPAVRKLLVDLFSEWDRQREKVHWGPVVEIVSSLPKDELAAMAESLVNLTKFRRRVTTEKETVGGPIDVAVITKGDGFVWVKRKHYFEANLNPRRMGLYLKEVTSDART